MCLQHWSWGHLLNGKILLSWVFIILGGSAQGGRRRRGEWVGGRVGGCGEGTPEALPPSEIKHLASGIFGPSRRISHREVSSLGSQRESHLPHIRSRDPLMTLLATIAVP